MTYKPPPDCYDERTGALDLSNTRAWPFSSSARDSLIDALTKVNVEHAREIVDALDAYLAEDPSGRVPAMTFVRPNQSATLEALRKERDEAVARAEKAERALSATSKPNGTKGFDLDDPAFRQAFGEFVSGFASRKTT